MYRFVLVVLLVACGGDSPPVGMSAVAIDDLAFRCTQFEEIDACYALRDVPDAETRAVALNFACRRHHRDACSLNVAAQYALKDRYDGTLRIAFAVASAREACVVDGDLAMCEHFLQAQEQEADPDRKAWLATQRPEVEAALAAGRAQLDRARP